MAAAVGRTRCLVARVPVARRGGTQTAFAPAPRGTTASAPG
jgi:hypothetical protein